MAFRARDLVFLVLGTLLTGAGIAPSAAQNAARPPALFPVATDTRVGGYKEIEGYQIATEFLSMRDGKAYFKEEYEKIRVYETIPAALFDPTRWSRVQPRGGP